MKIACLGGGPAGLYFAISHLLRDRGAEVTVIERNRPDDTFGWGVVLSDETLGNLAANDAPSADAIREHFAYWDDMALVIEGARVVSGGHGFCGIGRKRLLRILTDRARALGAELRFETEADVADLMASHDLVVAADGLNSRTRARFEDAFRPMIDRRACKFCWLGTTQSFEDAFTFIFEETEHGWMWVHAYQFEPGTATFIVECGQATWDAWGFGDMTQEESVAACERIFARHLGGHPLMSNARHIRGSAWINFPRVLCERWHHENVVLMGDAAATAHFSIGSGTKLALEGAIGLAEALAEEADVAAALARYEEERRVEALRLQTAALNSLEWFETVERRLRLDPVQLNYAMLTRSQRIGHENLRRRDPAWLAGAERWFAGGPNEPVDAPLTLGGALLPGRVAGPGAALTLEPAGEGLRLAGGTGEIAVPPAAILHAGEDPGALVAAARAAGAPLVYLRDPDGDPDRKAGLRRAALADRIRHEAGVAVMIDGGGITRDDANGLLLAGRADVVAMTAEALGGEGWAPRAEDAA